MICPPDRDEGALEESLAADIQAVALYKLLAGQRRAEIGAGVGRSATGSIADRAPLQ